MAERTSPSRSLPQELVEAATREAELDAACVAAVLDVVRPVLQRDFGKPMKLPATLLLGLGVFVRLRRWARQGSAKALNVALPTSEDGWSRLWRAVVTSGSNPDAVDPIVALWTAIHDLFADRLAWRGDVMLGGAVVVGAIDDQEQFVDALARLVWACRHQEEAS